MDNPVVEVIAIGAVMIWLMVAFAIILIAACMVSESKIEHPPWRQLPMFALGWPVYLFVAGWRRMTERRYIRRLRDFDAERVRIESSDDYARVKMSLEEVQRSLADDRHAR